MSEEGAEKNIDAECYVVRFGLKNGSIYRFYYTPADKLIEWYGGEKRSGVDQTECGENREVFLMKK